MAEEPGLRVLICDDSETVRAQIRAALAGHQRIEVVGEAADGEACLAFVRALRPDVVLMDVEMPRVDGVEATRLLAAEFPELRVVALTGSSGADTVIAMLDAGARSYVVKGAPVADLERVVLGEVGEAFLDQRVVPNLLEEVVRLLHDQKRMTRQLEALTMGVVRSFAAAIEARDGYTAGHVERVARLSGELVAHADAELAADPQTEFGFLLHDLGKLGVADAILRKPGLLEVHELAAMRAHVEIGARVLEPIPGLARAREIVLCHHERWDGEGYPRGLAGAVIPLAARLFAVCDAFDAMTTDRPYREAMPIADALDQLEGGAGTQFDPEAVELFVSLLAGGLLAGGPLSAGSSSSEAA